MKKRPDITDATRERFVDTFCKLYETKPIEKITVKEIAEKAGHNRVTFYQYFHDAYEIVNGKYFPAIFGNYFPPLFGK